MIEGESAEHVEKMLEGFKSEGVLYLVALKTYSLYEHTFTTEQQEETFEAMKADQYWIEVISPHGRSAPGEVTSNADPHALLDAETRALPPYQRYQKAVEKSSEFIEPRIPIIRL